MRVTVSPLRERGGELLVRLFFPKLNCKVDVPVLIKLVAAIGYPGYVRCDWQKYQVGWLELFGHL